MATQNDVPLGQPTIREWQLAPGNTTRYDRLQAAPSDHDLIVMWSLWSAISIVIAIFVTLVLLSIVTNRKARSNPFNLYLVYLMIPDIIFSALCGLTCTLNAITGHYYSVAMCQAQSFYLVFGIAGNSWLNMLIARELHLLLQSSVTMKKYTMPTTRQVTYKAMGVYAYSLFLSTWGIWGSHVSWFPHQTVSISGLGCFPLEYNLASSLFYFLCFIPLVAGIPIAYVLYICYDMRKRKLLPPAGKRRLLSVYFLRVVAAYVFMWTPHLLLCLMGSGQPWAVFAGGTWGHFQGVVSAGLSLTKPDIYKAVVDFLTCRQSSHHSGAGDQRRSTSSSTFRLENGSSGRSNMLWPGSRRQSTMHSSVHISGVSAQFDRRGSEARHSAAMSMRSSVGAVHDAEDSFMPRQRDDFTFDDEDPVRVLEENDGGGDDEVDDVESSTRKRDNGAGLNDTANMETEKGSLSLADRDPTDAQAHGQNVTPKCCTTEDKQIDAN